MRCYKILDIIKEKYQNNIVAIQELFLTDASVNFESFRWIDGLLSFRISRSAVLKTSSAVSMFAIISGALGFQERQNIRFLSSFGYREIAAEWLGVITKLINQHWLKSDMTLEFSSDTPYVSTDRLDSLLVQALKWLADSIQKTDLPEKFYLRSNNIWIKAEGMRYIWNIVSQFWEFFHLDFFYRGLWDEWCIQLAEGMNSRLPKKLTLIMRKNWIKNVWLKAISEVIRERGFPEQFDLDLCFNEIWDDWLISLAQAIEKVWFKENTEIDLSCNSDIWDRGAEALWRAIKVRWLVSGVKLKMSDNQITDKWAQHILDAVRERWIPEWVIIDLRSNRLSRKMLLAFKEEGIRQKCTWDPFILFNV